MQFTTWIVEKRAALDLTSEACLSEFCDTSYMIDAFASISRPTREEIVHRH